MPYRAPIDVSDYIEALGDDEVELRHTIQLSRPAYSWDSPYLWGDGDAVSSTCTDLALRDLFIWDPNRYYRSLGFEWPYQDITRKDLRKAYQRLDGQNDVWLTYCFSQLLDNDVRKAYDSTPLGEVYFDEYWEAYFKREAEDQAAAYRQKGYDISAEDILDEWGFDTQEQSFEEQHADLGLEYERAPDQQHRKIESDWDWAFYVWQSPMANLDHLAKWQALLVTAMKRNRTHGIRVLRLASFGVGVMGHNDEAGSPPVVANMQNSALIFFLRNDVKPTEKIAQLAVKSVLNDNRLMSVLNQSARHSNLT